MKKTWCSHIRWVSAEPPFWICRYGPEEEEWLDPIYYGFKFCPKCGTRRPKAVSR